LPVFCKTSIRGKDFLLYARGLVLDDLDLDDLADLDHGPRVGHEAVGELEDMDEEDRKFLQAFGRLMSRWPGGGAN
jgi:hypothetical protein